MKKNSNLKYQLLYKELLASIESGELKPDQKLLPEEQLAEKYNVSRITVRNALGTLEELGYITRIRGKGTFVNAKTMEKSINNIISFTESCLMVGNTPSSKVLEFKLINAPLIAINYLDITEDDYVWFIKRVRYVNNLTVLYEKSYWSRDVCGEITVDDAADSILTLLAQRGVKPQFLKQEFAAISADGIVAANLEVPENFPVLRSTLAGSTSNHQPVFLSVSYYRTDRMTVSFSRSLQ